MPSVIEDGELLERSGTIDRRVNWYKTFGESIC